MSIKYTVVSKKPRGMAGDKPVKYYPILTGRDTINLDAVCAEISKRSSLSKADVVGVVYSFIEVIPQFLLEGNNVRLDGFGTYSLHASGNGKEHADKVTANDITKLRMAFLPDKKIKQQLNNAKFEKSKIR